MVGSLPHKYSQSRPHSRSPTDPIMEPHRPHNSVGQGVGGGPTAAALPHKYSQSQPHSRSPTHPISGAPQTHKWSPIDPIMEPHRPHNSVGQDVGGGPTAPSLPHKYSQSRPHSQSPIDPIMEPHRPISGALLTP